MNCQFKAIARVALLFGLLLGSWQLHAATPARRVASAAKARAGLITDFSVLSTMRPRKCVDEKESTPSARGWHESAAHCAWQGRLQMRRWETDKGSDPTSCISTQALWWAWMQSRLAPNNGPTAWNSEWAAQSLIDESGAQQRVAIIERTANGAWAATEWIWVPSPRTATRQWQAGRWNLLIGAAREIRQAAHETPVPQATALLKTAWEGNLNGRAGEISGERWLWERDGQCMRMESVGLSEQQLHLPYSRDDVRLEQRAAMQLRLARTYPRATWLTQFRLLPLGDGRGGAKYEAIWTENAAVRGQLWIPSKADSTIFQVRIAVVLPARKDNQADTVIVARIANSIDHELIGLATTWARDHEQ